MGITSHDVARLAGVSQPTVSRALRGDPRVAEATLEKVRKAAAALNYVPSEAGRILSTRATRRVGVIVTDLTNPFYPHLVAPLHDELDRLNHRMLLFTERSDTPLATERLLDHSIDGAVLATTTLGSRLPGELRRRELPYVFLNREEEGARGDAAVVDNRVGAEMVAQELIRLGHKRIAGIFGPQDTSTGRDRELGFRLALASVGLGLSDEHVRRGPFDFDTGSRALGEIMQSRERPTAVFCGNDVVAVGALDAAQRLGICVPRDLTVIGFDDLPMAAWASFELTSVSYDLEEMVRSAVQLLISRISGVPGEEPVRTVFPTRLVLRRTHDVPHA